jgi:hypothetical protein
LRRAVHKLQHDDSALSPLHRPARSAHAFLLAWRTQKPLAEARCAATALVNLTGDPRAAEAALEKGAIERAMEHVRDGERAELRSLLVRAAATAVGGIGGCTCWPTHGTLTLSAPSTPPGSQVMLLANLTVSPAGAALFLQQGKGALEGARARTRGGRAPHMHHPGTPY